MLLDQIKARLKAKYPGVNLSTKRIDAIAAKLEPKITEESQIDAALDDQNEIYSFANIAKNDDRERTDKSRQKQKSESEPSDDDDEEAPKPPKKSKKSDDDTPAWAKTFLERVEKLEKEKVSQSISEKVKAHEKLKDIPQSFLKGRALPDSEDGIDEFVAGIEADYTDVKQDLVNKGLSITKTPFSADVASTTVDADIANWAKKEK